MFSSIYYLEADFLIALKITETKLFRFKDLINEKTLEKCKKGVLIINCARGGIVNEKDLIKSLDSGHCGGAALDVYLEV